MGQGRLTRRELLAATAAGALSCAAPKRSTAPRAARPNILFVMADDLGYADLSCFGRRDYQTPHLDRLAREGVKLTHAYSASPVCSATRCALITGRYHQRFPVGLEEPLANEASQKLGLPAAHPTLPGLLRAAGYRTALVGKWHLGHASEHGPLRHGYDRFFGILGGAVDYFTHAENVAATKPGLREADAETRRDGYLTDLLTARAVEEIARDKQPFFLSLHYTSPHWPWEAPEDRDVAKSLKTLFHLDGGNAATYAAMVRSLDASVGRVMQELETRGLADDTIIVFTSDNGGERFSDNWPFSGMKTELLEGGIRVPTIVRWPERIRANTESVQVVSSIDWLPTLVAAAGARLEVEVDGESVLGVLTGAEPVKTRRLFWRYKANDQAAVRDGNWKYLRLGGREHLFDIARDPRERANLAERHPDVFVRLKSAFDAWNATMLAYPEGSLSHSIKQSGIVPERY